MEVGGVQSSVLILPAVLKETYPFTVPVLFSPTKRQVIAPGMSSTGSVIEPEGRGLSLQTITYCNIRNNVQLYEICEHLTNTTLSRTSGLSSASK